MQYSHQPDQPHYTQPGYLPQEPACYPSQPYHPQVPPQHHPYAPGCYLHQPVLQNQLQVFKEKYKSGNASKIAVCVAAGAVDGYVFGKALGEKVDIIDHSYSSSSSSSNSSSDSEMQLNSLHTVL